MQLVNNYGPLSGLLVLDFGQAAVGPIAASYLGMLGATVIKIEQPKGDMVRSGPPNMRGTSTTFIGNNLTKFGVVLDLKNPDGLERAKRLIAKADLLIENFRSPQVMARLGLPYDTVMSKLNPGLVYVQSSAFGASGPWMGMHSDEWVTEAVGGFVSVTGAPGAPEFHRGTAQLDWTGAMVNTVACLAGLLYRDQTGKGTMIQSSQLGSTVFAGVTRLAEYLASGIVPGPMGSACSGTVPDQAFRAADGFINVCVPNDRFWSGFCAAMEQPGLARDPRFASQAGRVENRDALIPLLSSLFATLTCAEWLERLTALDVPCGLNPARDSLEQIYLSDEQVNANQMVMRIDSAYGSILTQAPHWEFEKTPALITRPSPLLGEHTQEVLRAIADWEGLAGRPPAGGENAAPAGTLTGLCVVELAEGVPGPLSGMVLADLGADVTRIEPPAGDWLAHQPPLDGGTGAIYRVLNQGKRVVRLDLKTAGGRAIAQDLLSTADVIIVGYRAQKLERLGIAYDQIRQRNPRAVYCLITGWGEKGPRAGNPATEFLVQAAAGLNRSLGAAGAEPVRLGFDVVSLSTGLSAAQGILAGIFQARRSGIGQKIQVSMLSTAIAINQWATAAESGPDEPVGKQLEGPHWPRDHGFLCAEGRCLIGFHGDSLSMWSRLAVAIGRVDLIQNPRFRAAATNQPMRLRPLLNGTLQTWPFRALERIVRFELNGVLVPVVDIPTLAEHPQVQGLGVLDRTHGLRVRLPMISTVPLKR